MKTGSLYICTLLVCAYYAFTSHTYKTTNAHPESTGAPGDLTCAQSGCHDDATVTSNSPVNSLVFGNNQTTYVPGQTYTINISVNKTGIEKFGFEALALINATNKNAGTFIVTDGNRTQTENGFGPNSNRVYMTHTATGTTALTTGSNSWSFHWTAPSTNSGDIVFYYATNATNNNNQSDGDQIFLSSYTITPSAVGISENTLSKQTLFYSAETKSIHLNSTADLKSITVYNMAGQLLKQISANTLSTDGIRMDDLSLGVYLIGIEHHDSVIKTQKLLVY